MSDTPKTDALINQRGEIRDYALFSLARELERENAALRNEAKYHDEADALRKLRERERDDARAENAALREDIQTLCGIIDSANSDAWKNGNTHPDGHGPDEGAVLMAQLYSPLWHKYMQPVIAARKEAQP